ncbi:MAG: thioredoxin domain-containing protein [Mojavia pulchra JT2-VF2]|jgi:protein-disulfide isomerase|uniref:Thioredoxin domain-containing protein n=1 Tax=Mojavia pulchra JT2-VF2 TaxID=287848 RepID=A0A951UHQ0_9NOST|nr:thioredoxin domain-containing protein [Mojavia pulchra JT2-VF2]
MLRILQYFGVVVCLLYLIICQGLHPAFAATRIDPQIEAQVLQILRNHPEAIIESLEVYQKQEQEKLQQTRQIFLQDLKTNPQTIIANSPTTGKPDAKVVLVEFSDFQCPFCAKAHDTVKEFMDKHQDEVKMVYKHLPLANIHAQAIPAAQAAWAAQQQGKFWEYHDALFSQQGKLGEDLYLKIAQNLNLDVEKFKGDQRKANAAIAQDMQLASKLGLSGTPFFIMNGETFSGAVELEQIEEVLSRVR